MNRKSRNYDKPYYDLFLNLVEVFVKKMTIKLLNYTKLLKN